MLEYYGSAAALRLLQIIVYSSLWIVIGCFIAAVFRRMVGPAAVRRLFGDHTSFGLIAGWLIGMLLPVCSLGVIPIIRELHRAGVKRGTIVAFGLTAPLFNPMSVLYGLTLSDPIAILTFSLCAMVIVSLIGFVWNKIVGVVDAKEIVDSAPTYGVKRIVSVFDSASRELIGPTLGYLVIGIVASVLLAVFLPHGYLQNQVERDNLLAPIVVAAVATPIYSTPLLAMSQIGGMFQHGNSIGAAFSLLVLGAGINIGLLVWFVRTYGFKRFSMLFLLLVTITVGLAYLIDKPLYPKGVEPAGHTHAFDVYTNPFNRLEKDTFETAKTKMTDYWIANEFGGTFLMGSLAVMGLIFQLVSRGKDLESWYCQADENAPKFDRIVPTWVLGMTVVAGLVVASVVGSYLYYPAPNDTLQDLFAVNTEAVLSAKTKDWEAAEKWIGYSDDLSRRLEVGVYLRQGSVSEFKTAKARVYRERLDDLKMAVDTRTESNIDDLAMEVQNAFRRMSAAFREEELTQ
jgi:uncharacterized membrane protein YraQ (UPF0718 family)